MKKQIILLTAIVFTSFFMKETNAQSALKPVYAHWMAGSESVTMDVAYNKGVPKPNALTFKMFFDKNVLSKYSADKLTFEFTWFHYYTTQKEYMDSYTVKYNSSNFTPENKYVISSSRENIMKGWWEVRVKAKYDNKEVYFNGTSKFQIYIQ